MKGVSSKQKASSGSFSNNGGPVLQSPKVRAVYWGGLWGDSTHISESTRLSLFLQDLLNSSLMNLLSQYGVGAGSYIGQVQDSSVSGSFTDSEIQKQLQKYYDSGFLPEPDGSTLNVIFLDENLAVNDPGAGLVLCEPSGDTAFGYHNFFITSKGNPAYYAIIPALTDACLAASCGGNSGCTLSLGDTQEQRRTEVTTHEFCEACSDPQLNAWTDSSGNEIGDVCTAKQDITVNGRVWRVQTIWDNAVGSCTVGDVSIPSPPVKGSQNANIVIANLFMLGLGKLLGKV